MKNAVKKIFCAVLALVMVLGSVPAFAAEIGDTVKWVFYDPNDNIYLRDFFYAGTLQEGENELLYNVGGTGRQHYEFEAKNTGYYVYSSSDPEVYFGKPDSEGKINSIDAPGEYMEKNGSYCTLIYLTEGTYIIGIEFWDTKEEKLTVKFAGSEIVDLDYNQSDFDNRIINDDIHITELENKFKYFIYSEHTTITFSNGNKLDDYSVHLTFTADGKPTDGINNGKVSLMNYEEDGHSSIYYIDHIIESIELENMEDYLVAYEWYNGRYTFPDYNDEITVNYSDGTSETFVYGYDEENGEKRYVTVLDGEEFLLISHSELALTFSVRVAQHTFIELKCEEIIKTSISENKTYLKNNLEWKYNRFNSVNGNILEGIKEARSIESVVNYVKYFFQNLKLLTEMGEEIINFIKFAL